jgi:hypothetical protein
VEKVALEFWSFFFCWWWRKEISPASQSSAQTPLYLPILWSFICSFLV